MVEPPARVLIIDDEEIVLDSCVEILAGEGVTLATATDGTLGLQRVAEFQPDLVFVDLKMPGISGMQVIERIRALDPTIVTIVITGYATLDSAVEAMQKGAYDFVPKPFTPQEFRLVTRRGLERRRLALEAAALRREREVLREHFAAIISHELKAPLTALQQHLLLLSSELSNVLTDAQRSRLDRMQVRLGDLLAMIHTWLRVLATDIQKLTDTFRPTAVPQAVAKAVESLLPYAQRKDIQIAQCVPESLSPVWGDEGTLTEAFVNVIGNAVKYSYPGGRVEVTADEQGGSIVVTVRDHGVGIPPDELPHIFSDFYRGREARAAEGGGVGVGLALTRRIVEAHGGTITVEGTPGGGSTFVIVLPALASEARPPSSARDVSDAQISPQGGVP